MISVSEELVNPALFETVLKRIVFEVCFVTIIMLLNCNWKLLFQVVECARSSSS